jgi:hypothetical protein
MSEPIPLALVYGVLLVLLPVLVWVNIWYWKKRGAMTPEERKQEDGSLREPGDW